MFALILSHAFCVTHFFSLLTIVIIQSGAVIFHKTVQFITDLKTIKIHIFSGFHGNARGSYATSLTKLYCLILWSIGL